MKAIPWITSGRRFGPEIFRHFFLADIISLKTMAGAVFRFRHPLVLRVRFRTVAKTLSIADRKAIAEQFAGRWGSLSGCSSNARPGGRRKSAEHRVLKAHDLITSPAFTVIKAASEFKDKTTGINQLWQTDFTYLKVLGWGWFYLSTIC